MEAASVANQLPSPLPESLPPAGVIAPLFGRRQPPRVQEAEPAERLRTGTDDNESAFVSLMDRMQAQQRRNSLWTTPAGEA